MKAVLICMRTSRCKTNVRNDDGTLPTSLIETTVGRVIFNQFVPKEVGFVNALLTKEEPA
jgi:DNA-directed RNA polymerase subunit beta'